MILSVLLWVLVLACLVLVVIVAQCGLPGHGVGMAHPRRVLTGHTNTVRALAVAPDGSWLASAGFDRTVRIWDPHTGQTRHTLTGHTGHTGTVRVLAAAPDGSWLASASHDQTVRIWGTGGWCCAASFRTGHVLRTLVTDGRWVAVAGDRGPYLLTVTRLLTPDSGVSPMRR